MSKILYWFFMLSLRLYKKLSFLIILALIPVSVVALSYAAEQQSGFVNIVLCATRESDPVSSAVIGELMEEESIVSFSVAEDPRSAMDAVIHGQADEAWIFSEDCEQGLADYASVSSSEKPFVKIIGREDNVFLRLTREKLSGVLFKHCARAYYISYSRDISRSLSELSSEELFRYFDQVSITEQLFVFGDNNSHESTASVSSDYITSPIRGLLGVIAVICGMAAAMYYAEDERRGMFCRVREDRRIYTAFACISVAVLHVCIINYAAMALTGIARSFLAELGCIILYTLCVSSFCTLALRVFGDVRLLGSFIMPCVAAMIVVCPVFFDFRSVLGVSLLFAPTYFVNASFESCYYAYMVLYSTVCFVLCFFVDRARYRLHRK